MAKRRTPAQIRATKKLVAMNKARARKNSAGPKKTLRSRLKARGQMKRGGKALAKWVRSGMPSVRNRPKRKRNPEPKNKLIIVNGKPYMAKAGGSGRVIAGYGSTVMNRGRRKNPKGGSSGRVISGYGSTVMNSGRKWDWDVEAGDPGFGTSYAGTVQASTKAQALRIARAEYGTAPHGPGSRIIKQTVRVFLARGQGSPPHGGGKRKNPKGSGRVISGYGSTVMNSGRPPKGFIKCQAVRVVTKGGKQILQVKR